MFGLSWGQIGIILLVAVFVLGPERIPTAIAGALTAVRKLRALVAGAQADTLGQFSSEIAQLRQQLAELQDLAGISELRELHPQRVLASMTTSDPAAAEPATGTGRTDRGAASPWWRKGHRYRGISEFVATAFGSEPVKNCDSARCSPGKEMDTTVGQPDDDAPD